MSEMVLMPTPPAEITLPERAGITVIATNAQQMQSAQQIMIARVDARLAMLGERVTQLHANLEHAKKYKLRQSSIQSTINKALRRVTFYEKVRAALEAGYTLIPDMDVDIFAIRTAREKPVTNYVERTSIYESGAHPEVMAQETERPPLGEGRYVAPQALERRSQIILGKNEKGETTYTQDAWAVDYDEELMFPFSLAKAEILELTGEALAKRIFDELGVAPRRLRGNDPMVIGRVVLRDGRYNQRILNFLICWFVDVDTL